jgi:hypothetical protein
MSIPTVAWDETSPAGSQAISLGDNRIREMKTQIRQIIDVDHDFPSSGSAADNGQHKKMTLQEQADLGTGAEGVPILGAQTVSGKAELVFTDEDDNDIQITSGGVLMVGQLANDTYFLATDAAGTGTVNLIKASASDGLILADGAEMASDAAPTTDAGVSNKKYVDDQVASIVGVPSGVMVSWGGAVDSPPSGWLFCDGSAVSRSTYSDLFTAIGTTWGSGDGSTTFNLPDATKCMLWGAGGTGTGSAVVGSSYTSSGLAGTDSSITLLTTGGTEDGNEDVRGADRGQNVLPSYLAIGFIIKT